MKRMKTIDRLSNHYRRDALQQTLVYYWIKEVKSGRKDLSDIQPPGRAPDESLHHVNNSLQQLT
jgi:hypothetical protein